MKFYLYSIKLDSIRFTLNTGFVPTIVERVVNRVVHGSEVGELVFLNMPAQRSTLSTIKDC